MAKKLLNIWLIAVFGVVLGYFSAQASAQTTQMKQPDNLPRGTAQQAVPVRPSTPSEQNCEKMKHAIEGRENWLNNREGSMAGCENEIQAARDRLSELQKEKAQLQEDIARLNAWIKEQSKHWEETCGRLKNCKKYEEYLDRLLAQLKVLLDEMTRIDQQRTTMESRIVELERLIYSLRDEYDRMKCNNLVPGQTTQSTIERCAAIFSEWNKLQAEINMLRVQLDGLLASYAAKQKQADLQQKVIAEYTTYLATNCKHSTKLQAAKQMEARHAKFRKTAGSIRDAIERVKKLRAIRLDVTTK